MGTDHNFLSNLKELTSVLAKCLLDWLPDEETMLCLDEAVGARS